PEILHQMQDERRADEAAAAGHQYPHRNPRLGQGPSASLRLDGFADRLQRWLSIAARPAGFSVFWLPCQQMEERLQLHGL
ncbi:hypothetical protein, partial [Methylobacterium sp. CCH5-D2]|uniref:hypothetical protein n=1 Tax=Methylobacterium sp. CCH5-D2 TaxID=1768765 RepID=UPI001AED0919